jgi:predicted ATP-dependent endonuclease of OLD family
MEIAKIEIKNFRSIKDEVIEFSHNCLILLGKNEAGKSNLLKAIAAVFGKYEVSDKDKRKRIDNEKIDLYYVRAIVRLSQSDIIEIETRFKKKYATSFDKIVFKKGGTLKDFITSVFYEFVISIPIGDKKVVTFSYWKYPNTDFDLATNLFLTANKIVVEVGTAFDLRTEIFEMIKKLYFESPYKCHYWQYSENYLLPSSVDVNDFIANPSKYTSLANIFSLCNRGNIKREFDEVKAQDGDYSNLLEQVSKSVSKIFQKIWKDFKNTSIQLQPNGTEILIKVVDKAKYSFEDRSDGFKKFISILLMLSAQSRSNKMLEKDIILIDEPDQSLYPTSAKYLRDELLDMSIKSKIIYSTHSQYMIDSACLGRHLVVEKSGDVTSIKKESDKAPFSSDELLRRAIGSSIFECLQPVNLIFEGWLDKELFNKYCQFNNMIKEFSNYGIVYLSGISGVETLVQLLILANKKFFIIADSDETSNNKRIIFSESYPEHKDSWISYSDFVKGIVTMEDFFETDYVQAQFISLGYDAFVYNLQKPVITNIENAANKDKESKQKIKNKLVECITKDSIKVDYLEFVNQLKAKLSVD